MPAARTLVPLVTLSMLVFSGVATASEGMWMPLQTPDLASELRALGFEGDPASFADLTGQPMGAVVSLGFCTASFVSPDGLIVTNHHCSVGALQFNSTPDQNLLADGFLAESLEDELSNGPGFRVWVTTSFREVTDDIIGSLADDVTDDTRDRAVRRKVNEAIAACELDTDRCVVRSFFGGLRWYEMKQMEIEDVRLVYAPAEGIGVFGGETDNFSWPRHTGDWTFHRAYVAPDGTPAPYSDENVPYKPERWLQVSPEGVNPGDLVVVAGYPGRTYRLRTVDEVREVVEWSLPTRIRTAEERLAILEELAREDDDLAIKVNRSIRGLENGLKYRRGVLAGMVEAGALSKKAAEDRELRSWIAASAERVERFGGVLTGLNEIVAERSASRERDTALVGLRRASSYLGSAYTMFRLAVERERPDLDRRAGYQDRDRDDILMREQRSQRTLDARVDRALLRHAMLQAARLPADQRLAFIDEVVGLEAGQSDDARASAIEGWLSSAYERTSMGDLEFRVDLMDLDRSELEKRDDPFLDLARRLHPDQIALEGVEERRDGIEWRLRPLLSSALLELRGGQVAPDANGTLRVTFGLIEGAEVRDGLAFTPQTTLRGLRAKYTGSGDFDAPETLIDSIDRLRDAEHPTPFLAPHLGDVPVNFLSSVDTTGGNSGSPTLNGRGELVGLLFDGTWESIAADYVFDPAINRSIHVDVRYMLWVMDVVDSAHRIMRELGIGPTATTAPGGP